ncbi:hypothetical protein [Streptomyces sp. NBC_00154]|nr:hypothetical protein [Streptomyces sp. NBC_00154]MCX5309770.1 hypothetical protein [Streptomyces sp. NBC_00154]
MERLLVVRTMASLALRLPAAHAAATAGLDTHANGGPTRDAAHLDLIGK